MKERNTQTRKGEKKQDPEHLKEKHLRIITRNFLYALHKRQNCCEVCRQCRQAIIDESMRFAELYALITTDTE
ncbi:MAG TPA: hypothetical protein VFU15_10240 [Bacteroidia bacterium]|nr:hypothetical protein [Bacteroidia bacterium]